MYYKPVLVKKQIAVINKPNANYPKETNSETVVNQSNFTIIQVTTNTQPKASYSGAQINNEPPKFETPNIRGVNKSNNPINTSYDRLIM